MTPATRGFDAMLRFLPLALAVPIVIGCGVRGTTNIPAPKPDPKDEMTAQQRVRKAVPVLNRTLTQNDLNQLFNYMTQYHATNGKYPKSLDELNTLGVGRDAPHIAKAIQSGELVLAGGTGDVLAYEKDALDGGGGSVVTTSGIVRMTAGDLREKLGR
jgi:hypothetical protein